MSPVDDRVLNWLYSVLINEYTHVNRTYNDAAETLAQYPSLPPRTDVYTYENGVSALLLLLTGTLPVRFRGDLYRFPIAIWIPHAYPREAPMVYVTPNDNMLVRPGQHVSAEGKIYHPYLSAWPNYWDKSTLSDLLAILRTVFAKEPPVIAKQGHLSPYQPAANPAPPPVPPTPEEWRRQMRSHPASPAAISAEQFPTPPPKPPKDMGSLDGLACHAGYSRLLEETSRPLSPTSLDPCQSSGHPDRRRPPAQDMPQRVVSLADQNIPSVPREEGTSSLWQFQSRQHGRGNLDCSILPSELPDTSSRYSQPPPLPQQQHAATNSQPAAGSAHHNHSLPRHDEQWQTYMPASSSGSHLVGFPEKHTDTKPAIPDYLTSELDVQLPTQTSAAPLPVPPVPPNPQKDALLSAISASLVALTTRAVQNNEAALPALHAQSAALQAAHRRLQQELDQLQQLDAALASNERVLAQAMREADGVMDAARTRTVPDVDDTLVAPTIVGGQLWSLVAEERGLEDAIFLLGRALDRGRVGADVFVKQTRSLAREQFLKKALIKKISKGMGLDDENVEFGLRSAY